MLCECIAQWGTLLNIIKKKILFVCGFPRLSR
jgi:hypothetical protein